MSTCTACAHLFNAFNPTDHCLLYHVPMRCICRAGRARGFDSFFELQRRSCNQLVKVRPQQQQPSQHQVAAVVVCGGACRLQQILTAAEWTASGMTAAAAAAAVRQVWLEVAGISVSLLCTACCSLCWQCIAVKQLGRSHQRAVQSCAPQLCWHQRTIVP